MRHRNHKPEIDFLQIIADDKSLITYRPKLNQITGSVTSTILLQQILYWWKKSKEKPFYKFKAPCKHPLYKDGDSWCEELGFSTTEFDTALRKIACKTTKEKQNLGDKFVYYWTTRDRLTFYNINESNLAKSGMSIYVNKESGFTKTMNPDLDIKTEITQKITQDNKIYTLFLEKWNENKIIIHKKITSKRKAAIDKVLKLKDYTQEEIFKAFQNYATVLHSPDYFFKYPWTMEDFLQRGLHEFVDEAIPLTAFKKFSSSDNQSEPLSQTKLSSAGFPIITKSYDRKSKFRKTVEEWQALLETNTNKLLSADIWKTNHIPNKITVFNNVVSMQVWLDNVDFGLYGGSNLQNRIKPLHKLIDYYILCISEWWGWMDGVKDNVFDINNKIFKMFIREMEDTFPARIEIKSNGWINDSDWEPRD